MIHSTSCSCWRRPPFRAVSWAARLIGAIAADQRERDGRVEKNDRLIAVAERSRQHRDVHSLDDLPAALLEEIEHFFVSSNAIEGKAFTPTGRVGPERARELVEEATIGLGSDPAEP